jgi:hypothetical protein
VTAPDALLREALAKLTALESDIERERSYNGRAVDTDESAIELREAIVALAATPPASDDEILAAIPFDVTHNITTGQPFTPPASAERDAVVELATLLEPHFGPGYFPGTNCVCVIVKADQTVEDAARSILRAAEARDAATPPASAVAYTNATAEDYVMAEPTPPAEPAERGWSPRSKSTS